MEEQKLTAKESLELITEMIQNTKQKVDKGDGNALLIWGYTSSVVSILVYLLLMITENPLFNWLWFLIPAIGLPLQLRLNRKNAGKPTATTFVDKISTGMWRIVGLIAAIGAAVCVVFMLFGYNAWIAMFIYAFVIVGLGSAVQGVIINERSLIVGGLFSIFAGCVVTGFAVCGLPIFISWSVPLYIVCFMLMMVVPGHIINNKAKKLCRKN